MNGTLVLLNTICEIFLVISIENKIIINNTLQKVVF